MFSMSCMSEAEIAGTIEVERPIFTLGTLVDARNNMWDIRGIIRHYVQACPIEILNPYFSCTDTWTDFGLVHQEWQPYLVKIVGDTCEACYLDYYTKQIEHQKRNIDVR